MLTLGNFYQFSPIENIALQKYLWEIGNKNYNAIKKKRKL